MHLDTNKIVSALEEELKSFQFGTNPPELYEPIRYLLSIGGKRMRPLLTILTCYMFDQDYKKAFLPALATEVFHNFTLMHDDIMDKAPLRRGMPTVHEKWNANVAILSGDVMLVRAYQMLLAIKGNHLTKVIDNFSQCAAEVCEGQQMDMNFEQREQVPMSDYLEMIRLKTAVLLGFCMELGGIIGGTTPEKTLLLRQAGIDFGLGFQLRDDLLDVYGEQLKFGKQVGGDIISNKKTFLLIRALEKARGQEAEKLNHWLKKETFDPTEKVQAVTQIYDNLGIKEETETYITSYFSNGLALLQESFPETTQAQKEPLLSFIKKLINRDK